MLFTWLKRRRRRRLLAQPFPDPWLDYLHRNVFFYQQMTAAEQAKLRDDLRVLIAEKNWEGCGGLHLTDEIKVTIAAQACLLTLALEPDSYARVASILVYPHGYLGPGERRGALEVEFTEPRLGEAWYRGPVVLSWADALQEGRRRQRGRNLVFHEFAHQLDMLDGAVNGIPLLGDAVQAQRWQEIMSAEYQRLVAAAEAGEATLLDDYGATDEAEFFAVATECFFTRPVAMHRRHPELYEMLSEYYRQDPATWHNRLDS
jgi:Mlc titration factor MtfA (ptsG expression regulator)